MSHISCIRLTLSSFLLLHFVLIFCKLLSNGYFFSSLIRNIYNWAFLLLNSSRSLASWQYFLAFIIILSQIIIAILDLLIWACFNSISYVFYHDTFFKLTLIFEILKHYYISIRDSHCLLMWPSLALNALSLKLI